MILDFKNLDRNPDYMYLEDSITEAVRNYLREKYEFKELPRAEWQKLAEKDLHLWPEDNYTRSFGLHLGALARQDVVVGGYYQAIVEKKGNAVSSQVVRAHVFVIDVGQRKVVTEFDVKMPVDASLFAAVEELAARVARESKSVLPNKGTLEPDKPQREEISPHELGVLAGISAVSVPAAHSGNFRTDQKLHNKDVPQNLGIYLLYRYHDFYFPKVVVAAAAGVQFGATNFPVSIDTKKVRVSVVDYSLAGHCGYRLDYMQVRVIPFGGLGFSLARVHIDYSALSLAPLDTAGNPVLEDSINTSAPFAEIGLRLELQITPRLSLGVQGFYRQHFYLGESFGQLFTAGGFFFRL